MSHEYASVWSRLHSASQSQSFIESESQLWFMLGCTCIGTRWRKVLVRWLLVRYHRNNLWAMAYSNLWTNGELLHRCHIECSCLCRILWPRSIWISVGLLQKRRRSLFFLFWWRINYVLIRSRVVWNGGEQDPSDHRHRHLRHRRFDGNQCKVGSLTIAMLPLVLNNSNQMFGATAKLNVWC